MIRPAVPADLSAALLRAPLASAAESCGDRCAALRYGLLAALLSAAVTALLLGGAA
jgi:hypothetical protein